MGVDVSCWGMTQTPAIPDDILAALDALPNSARPVLVRLRGVIFDVASTVPGAGDVSETLKWGQPSYAVSTGTPLRLGVTKTGIPSLFVHCQTSVVSDARSVLAADLQFEGNRAVLVAQDTAFPEAALRQVIHAALSYRLAR